MVEQVEHLDPELRVDPLRYMSVLEDGEINVL